MNYYESFLALAKHILSLAELLIEFINLELIYKNLFAEYMQSTHKKAGD